MPERALQGQTKGPASEVLAAPLAEMAPFL
jgi:hypothetical protein